MGKQYVLKVDGDTYFGWDGSFVPADNPNDIKLWEDGEDCYDGRPELEDMREIKSRLEGEGHTAEVIRFLDVPAFLEWDIVRMKYLRYDHLPENLKPVSKLFYDLAAELAHMMEDFSGPNDQFDQGMQRLIEAKDCFVRAAL